MKRQAITCFLLVFLSSGACAEEAGLSLDRTQVPAITDGEQVLRQKEKEIADKQNGQSRFKLPILSNAEIKPDKVCVDINDIQIEGVTLLTSLDLEGIRSKYLNKCLGENSINALLGEINNQYIKLGYITSRAYLPKQKIESGLLKLKIIEGTIEEIILNEDSSKNKRKVYSAFSSAPGDKLNLRSLENGLDQMNSVKSAKAKLQLWPGKKDGASRVALSSTPDDEVRGYLTLDNQGSASTGKTRLRLGVEYDNLLDLNDAWSLYYIGSNDTNALAFDVRAPYKDFDFSYSWSNSEYVSLIVEDAELYGLSNTHTIKTNKKVWRDDVSKLEVNGAITVRDPRRFINDTELTSARSATGRMGLIYTINSKGARSQYKLGISHGLNVWGRNGYGKPDHNFFKVDAGLIYSKKMNNGRYDGEYNFQYSNEPLWSSEQMNLGDLSTIRGFKETPIVGDSGFYSRSSYSHSIDCQGVADSSKSLCGNITPYAFLDAGVAHAYQGNRFDKKWGGLLGGGAGIKYEGKTVVLDLTVAKGLASNIKNIEKNMQVYITGTVKGF